MAKNRDSENQGLTPLERYLAKQKPVQTAPEKTSEKAPESAVSEASTSAPPPAPARTWQLNEDERTGPSLAPQSADFWMRFFAFLIDIAIVSTLHSVLTSAIRAAFYFMPGFIFEAGSALAWLVVPFFYYGWFYSQKGASPGKMLFHLQVLETGTGRRLGYWRAFLRETFGKFLSGIFLWAGFLIAAFRSDRQALHDMIFDTRVVRERVK